MRTPDRIKVDGESDVIRDQQKPNHASALKEIRRIAHGERVTVAKGREVLVHAFLFRHAEIRDRALSRIGFLEFRFLEPKNPHWASVNLFAGCNIVERAAEWVFSDDADIEVVLAGFSARRNSHELAEVEQVCGFHVVFRRLGLSGKQT